MAIYYLGLQVLKGGYRDLMLSLLYEDEDCGLAIVGEIQVRVHGSGVSGRECLDVPETCQLSLHVPCANWPCAICIDAKKIQVSEFQFFLLFLYTVLSKLAEHLSQWSLTNKAGLRAIAIVYMSRQLNPFIALLVHPALPVLLNTKTKASSIFFVTYNCFVIIIIISSSISITLLLLLF
jgi:hypothetical protein